MRLRFIYRNLSSNSTFSKANIYWNAETWLNIKISVLFQNKMYFYMYIRMGDIPLTCNYLLQIVSFFYCTANNITPLRNIARSLKLIKNALLVKEHNFWVSFLFSCSTISIKWEKNALLVKKHNFLVNFGFSRGTISSKWGKNA